LGGRPKALWQEGKSGQETFLAQFAASRETGNDAVIDSSPIAQPLIQLLEGNQGYLEEEPTRLLRKLEGEAGAHRSRDFPQSARALKNHIDRIASELERIGIFIERNDKERPRKYRIFKKEVSDVSELTGLEKGTENEGLSAVTSPDTSGSSDASFADGDGNGLAQADNEESLRELVELGWPAVQATNILRAIDKASATIVERTPQYVVYQLSDRRLYKISRSGQAERLYEN
jgi:hypothetical protein